MKNAQNWKVVYGEEGKYYNFFGTWGEAAEYASDLVSSGWLKSEVRIEAVQPA